ncbi:MAG: hypothetical protein PHD61_05600 [Bacteroidales bacterium]|nr:hypothetical protein [Lentimicrobiaceae bacterium]MDD5694761.1 hypothetical protein [Bacteroidales bacterium]
MKPISKILLILVIPTLFIFQSCLEQVEFPIEPYIELNSFAKIIDSTGIDNRGIIEISYQDGDGDIGLTELDTLPGWEYNLFIRYFEKIDGTFEEVFITYYDQDSLKLDTIFMNGRIPLLTPAGKNKAIKGIIQDTLFINNYSSPYDTIRFEVYIKDRAFHESNHVTTPEIWVKKQ